MSESGKKLVAVVKRRKLVGKKSKRNRQFSSPATFGGLPSFGGRKLATTQIQESSDCEKRDAIEESLESDEAFFDALPSDTMLALHNLTSNIKTCISIPLSRNQQYIRGVLECQLQIMQDAHDGDTIVSSELSKLFQENKIRAISSANRHTRFAVILRTEDYVRGVWDAYNSHSNEINGEVVKWYIQELSKWTGQRITASSIADSFSKRPVPNLSLDEALQQLKSCGLLMAGHSSSFYHLWLPSWGVVLGAWEDAKKKLKLQLKTSSYKERLETAVDQKYSPIPTKLLVQWLVSQGEIIPVERPAGRFLRLSK